MHTYTYAHWKILHKSSSYTQQVPTSVPSHLQKQLHTFLFFLMVHIPCVCVCVWILLAKKRGIQQHRKKTFKLWMLNVAVAAASVALATYSAKLSRRYTIVLANTYKISCICVYTWLHSAHIHTIYIRRQILHRNVNLALGRALAHIRKIDSSVSPSPPSSIH